MQQNFFYPYPVCPVLPQQNPMYNIPQNPNAVNINIVAPQAYGSGSNPAITSPIYPNGLYSLYGANQMPNMPLYPQNYNNMMNNQYNMQNPLAYSNDGAGLADRNLNDLNNQSKMSNTSEFSSVSSVKETENKKEDKTKKIVPLTDEYIKSLENYMNNSNPKIRLIGAKEVLERFKEDENRKDHPSLMPLLNKALRDSSPAVRFLGLTTLQLGYAVGNDETVTILKDIQAKNVDKIGEDSLLASEILLNMVAPQKVSVPMTEDEIAKAEQKASKEDKVQ